MNKKVLLALLLIVLSSTVSAFILDPASTGFGGQNRTENGKNMTRNWLFNNATILVPINGVNYLAVPWFNTGDNTVMNSSNLHAFQNGSWTKSNESFAVVTDEMSLAFHNIALYQRNDTLADAIINTIVAINDSGNTYASGKTGSVLTEWTTRWNWTGSAWAIYKDQVADTAIDADAYLILTLGVINQTGFYNSTNSNRAGARMALMCEAMVNNNFYNATSLNLINRVNQQQNISYFECGGSNVCSSLTSNDLDYQAYKGPVLEALAACKGLLTDSQGVNYTLYAESTFQNHLIQANWTPIRFTLGQGRAGKYANASSGQMPYFQCTNSCNDTPTDFLGTEDPDSMRIPNICRAAWAWSNITGYTLKNSTAYCQQFANITCLTNTTFGYKMNFTGSSYGTCADSGYKAVGLGEGLFFMYNWTQFVGMANTYNGHYGTCGGAFSLCEMDSQDSFGVYDKSFGLTTLAYAIGLMDPVFGANGSVSGNQLIGPISIFINSPLNATTNTTSGNVTFNVTVQNNNNLDNTSTVAGTLPQILYNSTFSATPANDGWTLNSWGWTSNGGGVINNTADSGAAAWTQNLSIGQMTNGYNITLNMSVSNFTNAKLFFGTTSGTQSGDRILIERNGNSVNIKHDGGSFGSFTVAMKQYFILTIFVNLTGNNITVAVPGSKWSEALANNHLTVNGSYLAFVPGQNMSTVNQNSTGWNISDINVTNVGNAYNITTTTTGNYSMNVSFYFANNTLIYQQNYTGNNTAVTYLLPRQANGNYTWYVTAKSKDNTANYTGLIYEINAAPVFTFNDSNGSITNSSFVVSSSTIGVHAANGTLNYGTTINLGTRSDNSTNAVLNTFNITGLTPGTLYYYNVTRCDAGNLCYTNGPYTVTTLTTSASLLFNATNLVNGTTITQICVNATSAGNISYQGCNRTGTLVTLTVNLSVYNFTVYNLSNTTFNNLSIPVHNGSSVGDTLHSLIFSNPFGDISDEAHQYCRDTFGYSAIAKQASTNDTTLAGVWSIAANGSWYVAVGSLHYFNSINCTYSPYFNAYRNNYNATVSATLTLNSSQAIINVGAYRLFLNNSISGFNATNGIYKNVTGSVIYANNGTNNIKVDVAGNYSKNTTCTVTAPLQTINCNVTDIYDNLFTIGASDLVGAGISAFSSTLTNTTINAFESGTTATGNVTFATLQGYYYYFTMNATGYALFNATLQANASTNLYNFSLTTAANSFNFSVYNESTNNLITQNVTIQLISGSYAINYSFSGGRFNVTGLPAGDYTITYWINPNVPRNYYVTLNEQTYQNIHLYIIDEDISQLYLPIVLSESTVPLKNITISLLRDYIISGSTHEYVVVEMERTDTNGKAVFRVVPNTIDYKLIITDGTHTLATTPTKFTSSTNTYTLNTKSNPITSLTDNPLIARSLTFDNSTLTYTFTWSDPSSIVTSGCLTIYKFKNGIQTTDLSGCLAGSTGSLTHTVNDTNNTRYLAIASLPTNTEFSTLPAGSLDVDFATTYRAFGIIGFIIAAIIFITFTFVGGETGIAGMVVSGAVALLILGGFGFLASSWSITVGIVIVVGIIIYRLGR